MESEVLIDHYSRRILATATAPGRCHDLRRRRQAGSRLPQEVYALVDLGYQGLQHEHRLTVLPFKATKKQPLDATDQQLAWDRLEDLRTLAKLRAWTETGIPHGYRSSTSTGV